MPKPCTTRTTCTLWAAEAPDDSAGTAERSAVTDLIWRLLDLEPDLDVLYGRGTVVSDMTVAIIDPSVALAAAAYARTVAAAGVDLDDAIAAIVLAWPSSGDPAPCPGHATATTRDTGRQLS